VLAVELCVTNPNRGNFGFRSVTVDLDVAGAPLASGASDTPVRLPAEASILIPFTFATTLANLRPQLLDVIRQGQLDYRLRGTVTLTGSLELTVPFSRSGHFGALELTQVVLSDAATPVEARCTRPRTI
jgi:hypothetical protein